MTRTIKAKARSLMLGRYGSFAAFIILYYLCSLIAGLVPAAVFTSDDLAVNVILRIVLSFLLLVLVNLLKVGISRAAYCTCYEKELTLRDIIYGFGESRDQFLKIEMILSAIQCVISLLSMILEHLNSIYSFDLWEYYGLYIAFSAVILVLNLAVTLRLTFAVYVVIEQPGIGAMAALRASLSLTKGRYFKYLFFRLSFAGMYALGYLSFMIGFLYVLPYMEVSVCLYYRSLTERIQ